MIIERPDVRQTSVVFDCSYRFFVADSKQNDKLKLSFVSDIKTLNKKT